jgi:hypothetical protein
MGGTEMRVLAGHAGKLYAGNGYWEDTPGPEPGLVVRVKYFGRHKGGAIRDGVLVAIIHQPQTRLAPAWSCDTDAVIAEMDAADGI